ncbi:failed axon connections [Planococcus citri]|uniref:failed axon connections n=1 Tax=Planococcus citri TaxID=170843 RepID=UPI0031F80FF9
MSEAATEKNVTQEAKEPKEESTPNAKEESKEGKEAVTETANDAAATTPPAPAAPKGCKKPNFEKDVIYLYQFSRTPTIPSVSPFCLKVETWLRLAGLKYENVDHRMKFKSKKGQLPFVELNGDEIADSSFIIKELSQKFEKDLDASLDNSQKNISHAIISMIENHFHWVVHYWKVKNPDNMIRGYKLNLQQFLGTRFPNAILNIVFKFRFSRKGLRKARAQGMGVHTPEEIEEFGKNDLKVLSDLLGDKPYFFGDEPTVLDVVAFSQLAQVYFVDKEVEYPLRDYLNENFSNLVGHVNRMKERCFADWDDICKTLDMNAHIPKPVAEEKEAKTKDEEKIAEKEGDKIGDDKDKLEKDKEGEKDVDENKDKGKEKEKENKEDAK